MIKINKNINDSELYNIYIFGDSHSKCFYRDKFLKIENINIFNNYKSSVSMKGVTNTDSRLKYGEYIIKELNKININTHIKNICVFKLGQVDIEYNFFLNDLIMILSIKKFFMRQ